MSLSVPARARRVLSLLTVIAIAGACTALGLEGGTSERAQLERQKVRWVNQHLSSYRFTYNVTCFCGGVRGPIEIEVRNGTVARAVYTVTDEPVPIEVHDDLPTIDVLFRVIARAITDRADLLDVDYHPTMGYPTRISLDHSFTTADDEFVHTANSLRPLVPE